MAVFVLVHGAWHGGWCWHKLAARLQARGHRVLAPDLAGLGDDRTPLPGLGFADWTDALVRLIEAGGEKVVLVGHSRGGMVVSAVAERIPERIERLAFIAAFLPMGGLSIMQMAARDRQSLIGRYLVANDALSVGIGDEGVVACFYERCCAEDIAFARTRLRPEPLFGLSTVVAVSAGRFGALPRTYIECRHDRAISLTRQRVMQAAWPGCGRVTLEADHSPFFSNPDDLTGALV